MLILSCFTTIQDADLRFKSRKNVWTDGEYSLLFLKNPQNLLFRYHKSLAIKTVKLDTQDDNPKVTNSLEYWLK